MTDLQIFRKMRRRLIWSRIFPFLKPAFGTTEGLCLLLKLVLKDEYMFFQYDRCRMRLYKHAYRTTRPTIWGYWWNEGIITPRLKTVKAAIKSLEKQNTVL